MKVQWKFQKKVAQSFTKFQRCQKNTKKAENQVEAIASRIISDTKCMLCKNYNESVWMCYDKGIPYNSSRKYLNPQLLALIMFEIPFK